MFLHTRPQAGAGVRRAGLSNGTLVLRHHIRQDVIRGQTPHTWALARGRARAARERGRISTPMLTVTFFLLGIGGVVAGCLYHESRRHAAACEQEEIDCKD